MSVAVYPRLGELLRASNLTVAELEREIEQRYGLVVDPNSLDRLTQANPIQHADLEVAGAAAAVLGVGLGDLFDVDAEPILTPGEPTLDPEQSQRLDELLDAQGRRSLSSTEVHEVEALVAESARRLHERLLPRIAERRGISVEQARREMRAEREAAIGWWEEFEADPKRRRALVARLKRQGARLSRAT